MWKAWFPNIPDIIISHNGPQFTCYDYIKHTTTSPYHAKSNWQTERMVQTMKRQQITRYIFSAFGVSEHQDWWYWHVSSPAIFRTQSILLTTVLLLKSCVDGNTFVKMKCRQKKQEKNFNRHAKKEPLKSLKAGDPKMMQSQSRQWTSGFVRDLHLTKRSYVIQSKGRRYRRNRKFLTPTRVWSNSVFRDDVPADTDVALRSNAARYCDWTLLLIFILNGTNISSRIFILQLIKNFI